MQFKLDCAVWEITRACNFRCSHCAATAGELRERELTTKEALTLCEDLAELKCEVVTIMGGEPFLRTDWHQIATFLSEQAVELSFVTNGWLFNDELCAQLTKLKIHTCGFSVDGMEEMHDAIRQKDSFARCISALKLLERYDLPRSVVTTVHRQNLKDLPKLRELFFEEDLCWQIQLASPHGQRFDKEQFLTQNEFYQVLQFIGETQLILQRQHSPLIVTGSHDIGYFSYRFPNLFMGDWDGCNAGVSVVGIQSNGNIKGCLALNDNFVEANLRDISLSQIWNSPQFFQYNRQFSSSSLREKCAQCIFGEKCKGGCNDMSYILTGQFHADPYCAFQIEQEQNPPLRKP